jgi:O-antigen ligase
MYTVMGRDARSSMFFSDSIGVGELERRAHRQNVWGTLGILLVVALALLLLLLLGNTGSLIGLIIIGGVITVAAVSAWLWQRPIRGLYVLFASAVSIDVNYSETTHDGYYIAHYVPFWQDITAWTHVHIVISVAEVFMGLLLIICLLKAVVSRRFRFQKGSLALPIGLYAAMILVGEVHGIGSGGNVTKSLWELRAQIYMLVAYLLACNLIKTRKEVTTLVTILLVGTGLRAVEGSVRYFLYFRGKVLQDFDVFPHDQAFFLNGFIIIVAILLLYGGPSQLKRIGYWLLPFVAFIDLAAQRRAAMLALGMALMFLLLITLVVHPVRRRLVRIILLMIALSFPPYYLKYEYSSGTIGEPARAIASNFHPDPRDAGSNQYRVDEAFDILSTMRTSPVFGYGFGKPMLTPAPLPDISQIYIWWNYMPHNSILWVWMRLGTIGYLLFWFMIGGAVVQGTGHLRRLRDPWLQGLMLFTVLMLLQEVVFGYLDLQWTDYRNLVAVGVLFALISRISRLAAIDCSLSPEKDRDAKHKTMMNASAFASLAVVDGRLQRMEG